MNDTMAQGLVLMLLGMGIVFCFLSLLVVALGIMSRFLRDDGAVAATLNAAAPSSASSVASDLSDPELLSAITAAVHSFRAKRDSTSKNTK